MIDVNKQLDYFNGLSYEEKKSHLLKMLEKIKDKHEIFSKSYATLSTASRVTESSMASVYKLIFDVSNWLENNQKATQAELQDKMWDYIKRLREEEERIRARESEEVDKLLENI